MLWMPLSPQTVAGSYQPWFEVGIYPQARRTVVVSIAVWRSVVPGCCLTHGIAR